MLRYRDGVRHANEMIDRQLERRPKREVMEWAEGCHERHDALQYEKLMDLKNPHLSDFDRGQAMAYGMFHHTGCKLKG